jgi:1-acylglycerone phosphate reductase
VIPVPYQSVYNASKAAFAMLSDTMRLELAPFNIKVVELKTGVVKTNITANFLESNKPTLREGSIYQPAEEQMNKILQQQGADLLQGGTSASEFARGVVGDVVKKNPPTHIYRGDSAFYARILPMLPFGLLDGTLKKAIGSDIVDEMIKKQKKA